MVNWDGTVILATSRLLLHPFRADDRMIFDHEAHIEDDGQVFDAVIHAITAERWHERHSPGALG